MPTARAAAAAATLGNALFVIGGRVSPGGPCSGPALPVVERYDIDTDTWSARAPLPSPRSDLAAVAHGGKIYVFGGCNGFLFLPDVDVYDPVTDTWSTAPADMPTARASLVAGIVGNRVYAIGGWSGGPPLAVNEVYSIARDTWATDTPMPTARGEAGAYSHGGRIYVVGGALPAFGTPSAANEVFKP
jgi:N-acetylneuraminic acid mutarotase